MKKFLLAITIAGASLLSFNSCTKEYITNHTVLPGKSYIYTVRANNWVLTQPKLYRFEISIPDLDKAYHEDGSVNFSISFNSNPNTYEIIPATVNEYHFSANHNIGRVTIFAEYRGSGASAPPADLIAKVVLTDASQGN